MAEDKLREVGGLGAPCLVADIDVAEEVPEFSGPQGDKSVRSLWMLVRMHTEPLGVVMLDIPHGGLRRGQVVAALTTALGEELRSRAKASGGVWPPAGEDGRLVGTGASRFLLSRQEVMAQAPRMTVVVCTRERPAGLERCLASLAQQVYPEFSILVVDNAPTTARSRNVVAQFRSTSIELLYTVEPRRGLSWARNRALRLADSDVIAWIDDDEVADRFWLAELARGFFDHPAAGAVAGIMLPAELATPAQIWFEQYGGHHKHRGFVATAFSPATASLQSPFFPLPPFGTGGNMAFTRDALTKIGGFDPALGAGTFSLAGEDTRAFTDVLVGGGTVVYQPSAVTRHYHRDSYRELSRQRFGYGVGLTAYYASLVVSRPGCVGDLVRLGPRFVAAAFGSSSLRSGNLPATLPARLQWANRGGLLLGPPRYLAARLLARYHSRRDWREHRPSQEQVQDRPPLLEMGQKGGDAVAARGSGG